MVKPIEMPEPEAVAAFVEQMIVAMHVARFPTDGVVFHLGISERFGPLAVGLSNAKRCFLVTVYHDDPDYAMQAPWVRSLLRALEPLGVAETWNGINLHGISIVLNVLVPDDYLACRARYVPFVDNPGYAKFDQAYAKALTFVRGEK